MGGKLLGACFFPLLLKDRLKALEVLLKEWQKDRTNKVLIFTKSVKLLDMLAFHLSSKSKGVYFSELERHFSTGYYIGYSFLKLEGGTKQTDRTFPFLLRDEDPDDTCLGKNHG